MSEHLQACRDYAAHKTVAPLTAGFIARADNVKQYEPAVPQTRQSGLEDMIVNLQNLCEQMETTSNELISATQSIRGPVETAPDGPPMNKPISALPPALERLEYIACRISANTAMLARLRDALRL